MSYVGRHWSLDPFVLIVAATVVMHEVGLARLQRRSAASRTRRRRWRSLMFYSGLCLLLLAVVSPIDYWADDYFYVHMFEHILISFFAPILIVAGAPWLPLMFTLPVGARRRVGRSLLLGSWSRPLRAVGRFVTNPWTALISFNIVMVVWHAPVLFDLAANNLNVHVWLMHGSLFVTGVLFWLQIIPSYPFRLKASPLWQMGSIISTNMVMFVLAMSLSIFTASSWYPVYANLPGITLPPFADQQIGAAILWVCGDFWAVPVLVIVVKRVMDQGGGLSDAVDRMLHRSPAPTLEEVRRPT